ncbi:hypothetical protein [Sporosarcina sp. ANT_H38]|nr:hypothetical protein [Sporosarcina sp. ANT_H38]
MIKTNSSLVVRILRSIETIACFNGASDFYIQESLLTFKVGFQEI